MMKNLLKIILPAITLCVAPGYVFAQNPYYVEVNGGQTSYCGAATGTLIAKSTNPGESPIVANWQEGYIDTSGGTQNFIVTTTHNVSGNFSFSLPSGSTKSYRAVLNISSGAWPSQHITLISNTPPSAGTLTGAAAYLNSGSGTLTYTGGSGLVQWSKKTQWDAQWVEIPAPAGGSYSLTETTEFKVRRYSNGVCSSADATTDPVKVEVYKTGTLPGPASVVEGSRVTLGLQDFYKSVIRWEISTDEGTTWTHIQHPFQSYRHEVVANTKFRVLVDLGPFGTGYSGTKDVTYTPFTQAYPNLINGANYVREQLVTTKGIKDQYALNSLTADQKNEVITYLDGDGRTLQQNIRQASSSKKDIITFSDYDPAGRQPTQYLPYVSATNDGAYRSNPQGEVFPFYANGTADKITDTSHPYAETVFDKSPLGRATEQSSPGYAWRLGGGHTKQLNYFNNIASEVRKFNTDGTSTTFYGVNELSRVEATDEDQKKNQTFTDKEGRTLMTRTELNEGGVAWLETYYIYNERNAIRYMVSPKGVAALKANGWSWTTTIKDQYVHEFVYDKRGRVIEKKVPGQAWMYYCYDRLDRLVLMQDGKLRAENKWMFFKYDRKGRVVRQGLYTNASAREDIQLNVIDPLYASDTDVYYEDNSASNFCFPTSNTVDHVRHTYDQYGPGYTPQGLPGEATPGTALGLLTSSSRLVLGSSSWLTSYYFYDAYGRVIQELSNNHLSAATNNLKTYVYNFEGKVTITKTYHNAGSGNTTTIVNKFIYDHAGRLKQIYQKNNSDAEVLVVHYNYNGLGQLVEKNLHCTTCTPVDPQIGAEGTTYASTIQRSVYNSTEHTLIANSQIRLLPGYTVPEGAKLSGRIGKSVADAEAGYSSSAFLQSVDLRYNIRGQLASINNSQLNVNSANNDETNDYFGMEFLYEAPESGLITATDVNYNGNISAVKWKGAAGAVAGATDQKSYKYTYDKTNRLRTSTSQLYSGAAWTKEAGAFNENIAYDANGNITSLQRNSRKHELALVSGLPVISYGQDQIDNLTYTYNSAMGDQLKRVTDASGKAGGFDNGTSGAIDDYTYDMNGNLLTDRNKSITTDIVYNHLGKPTQVNFTDGRKIEYVYDAAGTKLTMKVYATGGTLQLTTDYVDGFVYENNALSFFSLPEGRVVKKGSTLEYQYAIADHQGNTRVVFSSATPTPDIYTATFEDPIADNQEFDNVPTTSPHWVTYTNANNTPGGSKVVRLNQNTPTGPAKSLKVFPGDKVDMEVWTHFQNASGFGTTSPPLTTLITNVAGVFGGVSGGAGEGGAIYNGVDEALGNFGTGGNKGDNAPAAYLNYILFDVGYNVLNMGWTVVPPSALNTKQKISIPTVDIKEAGYIFVYLSYEDESNNYVEFDDFKVTHTKTNIIQYNEYYPFGLQASTSWTREDSKNDYLYNAGAELNASSGWYETFFRGYDPAIGRFNAVDPLATDYGSMSSYHYSFNNPVMFNDPMGASPNGNNDCLVCYSYLPTFDQMAQMDLARTYADMGLGHIYMDRVSTAQAYANAHGGVEQNQYGQTGYWVESGYQDEEGAGVQATFIPCPECAVAQQAGIWNGDSDEFDMTNDILGIKGFGVDLATEKWKYSSNKQQWKEAYNIHKRLKVYNFNVKTSVIKRAVPQVLKGAGRGLGALGGVVTVGQVLYNSEIKASNALDVAVTGLSFIPVAGWIIGGGYVLGDIITREVTGKSIGDHLDEAVGAPLYDWEW